MPGAAQCLVHSGFPDTKACQGGRVSGVSGFGGVGLGPLDDIRRGQPVVHLTAMALGGRQSPDVVAEGAELDEVVSRPASGLGILAVLVDVETHIAHAGVGRELDPSGSPATLAAGLTSAHGKQ